MAGTDQMRNFRIRNLLMIILLFISAASAQLVMLDPRPGAVTDLHRITVTLAGKPDSDVSLFINGENRGQDKVRVDGLLDFINIKVPSGPIIIPAIMSATT